MPRAGDADLTGQKFGMLTAVSKGKTNGKKRSWIYRCDCGQFCEKQRAHITKDVKAGRIANCGCSTNKFIGQKNTKHGMTRHPAYAVWRSMNDRCRLPTHQAWRNYGAREITVYPEWQNSFESFWEDMGAEYQSGLTLERRQNNLGYCKENCYWATSRAQGNNKRSNTWIMTPQGKMTVAQASRVFGIGQTTILYRLLNGWPQNRLLADPNFQNKGDESMTFSMRGQGIALSSEEIKGRL